MCHTHPQIPTPDTETLVGAVWRVQVLPFFQKFGFIIVFTIFCSYLWAVLFFVAACATLGPDGDTGNIATMYASVKRMVTGQKEAKTEEAGVNGNALSLEGVNERALPSH
jgi:multidrug efflux pump subunit AcrB